MTKPVAWYRGQNNANDVFGNHGTWTKTATYANGNVGRCFAFANYSPNPDGRGAIDVPLGYSNDLDPDGKFSMRCWVKQLDLTSYGFMFAKGVKGTQIGGEDYAFGVDNRTVKIWTGAPFQPVINTEDKLTANNWFDIIWTYNNGFHQVYINGDLQTLNRNNIKIQRSANNAFIGYHKYDPAFNAHVDEVRIYHDVITPDNVDVYTHTLDFQNGVLKQWTKVAGGTPPDVPNTHQAVFQNGLVQAWNIAAGGTRPLPHKDHQVNVEQGQVKSWFTM